MKISLIMTVHNRTEDVCRKVADSFRLPGNRPDEVVIVLDRTTREVADGCRAAWEGYDVPVRWVTIPGEPVWKSPVKAWNFGFAAATGDVFYCISSETVQEAWNVDHARRLMNDTSPYGSQEIVLHGKAECSCGPQGMEVQWGPGTPGNLLCDARHPRPLGFIWAAPAWAVKKIGGYDEEFDRGLWYDDDDFFLRLWRTGLDFLFTDEVAGTHLHHDRPGLMTPEGIEATKRNFAHYLQKHGQPAQMSRVARKESYGEKWTRWAHI